MRYVGGKHRIGKAIVEAILADLGDTPPQTWLEPFVGSGAVIENVPPTFNRIGLDANPWIIHLLQAVSEGWDPPSEVSNELWRRVRENKAAYPPELVAFVGFGCSYAARWFEGYARDPKHGFNFAAGSAKNLLKQKPKLEGVSFGVSSYDLVAIQPGLGPTVIYCDPPYKQSVKDYYHTGRFEHASFWAWCKWRAEQGHQVFVSEFNAPNKPWIKTIWEKDRSSSLTRNTGAQKNTEKLFKVLKDAV